MADTNHRTLIDVIVPLPIYSCLTYALPPEIPVPAKGSRVLVPVGKRKMAGIVRGKCRRPPSSSVKIKPVVEQLDPTPLISEKLFEFLEWVARYYFHPIGMVVAEAMPPGIISAFKGKQKDVSRPFRPGRKGPEFTRWSEGGGAWTLSPDQARALTEIDTIIGKREYKTVLLHGVTGCGKTEVYMQAAQRALESKRQVLVMVPEIAMTMQIVGRFLDRFGERVSIMHSGLTPAERRNQWARIKNGASDIVVGTRSAIFSPLDRLGLIVVDEEHDPSYKQDEHLRYHGRDLAVVRGKLCNAAVILGSATPSLSSIYNAEQGKYHLIRMPKRIAERPMPEILVVDRTKRDRTDAHLKPAVKKPSWLSSRLYAEMKSTFERNEQVLLFLNRRGFAPYVFCPDCGHVFRCALCDVAMTFHYAKGRQGRGQEGILQCHYCGEERPAMPVCPKCKGQSAIATGYGTQKVASDLEQLFPDKKIARLDRDTAVSRKRTESLLLDFRNRGIDCLVGTQMVTKGHDFPFLTLVGVLTADQALNFPEYHASERTFQLLLQVSGRPGRSSLPGKVIIQTLNPDHYVFKHIVDHDFNGFAKEELTRRQSLDYPPFGRIVNIRFSGKARARVEETARKCALALKRKKGAAITKDVEILGPAPAPLSRIRGKYRFQLLLKSRSIDEIRKACACLMQMKKALCPASVKIDLDIDPQRLL